MSPEPISADNLDTVQQRLLNIIASGPRAGFLAEHVPRADEWALPGPFGPMLLARSIGEPLQALGAALRYHGILPDDVSELAIVATTAACGSTYELEHHLPPAASAGVTASVLEAAVGGGSVPDRLLAATAAVDRSLASAGSIGPELLCVVEEELGAAAAFQRLDDMHQ